MRDHPVMKNGYEQGSVTSQQLCLIPCDSQSLSDAQGPLLAGLGQAPPDKPWGLLARVSVGKCD